MNNRYLLTNRLSRWIAASAALLAAVAASTGYAQSAPTLLLGRAATQQKDKAAFDQAAAYFESAQQADSESKKQEADLAAAGKPPMFPNESADSGPLDVSVAATLPRLTLADSLLAAALESRTSPAQYYWLSLGSREVDILALEGNDDVKKAREEGKIYEHPALKWAIFSRQRGAPAEQDDADQNADEEPKPIDYFLLAWQPSSVQRVTDDDLQACRAVTDVARPFGMIWFKKDGADRLQSLSKQLANDYLVIAVEGTIVNISNVSGEIKNGRLQLTGRYRESEIEQIVSRLNRVIAGQ